MNLHQKYFYFGKYDSDEEVKEGWEPGWQFRFRIDEVNEFAFLEDTGGNYFPVPFEHLYETLANLQMVQQSLLSSLIGAPNPYAQQVETTVSRTN